MAAPALDGGSGFVKKLYTCVRLRSYSLLPHGRPHSMVSDEDIPEIRWSADGESFLSALPAALLFFLQTALTTHSHRA